MNYADLLDNIASARGCLSTLHEIYKMDGDPNYELAVRNLTDCLDFIIADRRGMMTPSEVRSFNQNLKNMREGGT